MRFLEQVYVTREVKNKRQYPPLCNIHHGNRNRPKDHNGKRWQYLSLTLRRLVEMSLFYKNSFYKNHEDHILKNLKNILRIILRFSSLGSKKKSVYLIFIHFQSYKNHLRIIWGSKWKLIYFPRSPRQV